MSDTDPTGDTRDPETQLLATRQAVQLWLLEHDDACEEGGDLTDLNLRVWAAAFLRTTRAETREIEERLRGQGECAFARRVVDSARAVFEIAPDQDTFETVGRAFVAEALHMDEELLPWKPGEESRR